jgi:serine/threonine protein kinase
MRKLDHPNIIRLYEVIDDPTKDKLYQVMEYANGGAVFEQSKAFPLQPHTARRYLRDVIMGLEYLHLNRIVHRDLKPENLLRCLHVSSGEETIKIGDFGQSTVYEWSSADLNATFGTPAFLSPEICRGGQIFFLLCCFILNFFKKKFN